MRNLRLIPRFCGWSIFVILSGTARAQLPQPTPLRPSPQVIHRLREAVVELAEAKDGGMQDHRSELALPLAQLGDWDGALTLAQYDKNPTRCRDDLFQWRARQITGSGKWWEARALTASISSPQVRADVMLGAARNAIDGGRKVSSTDSASLKLRALLTDSETLLKIGANSDQWAYCGYLWARAGNARAARRVFDSALKIARNADSKSTVGFEKQHVQRVRYLEDQVGLIPETKEATTSTDHFFMALKVVMENPHDIAAAQREVDQLPNELKMIALFNFTERDIRRHEPEGAKIWFDQAMLLVRQVDWRTIEPQNFQGILIAAFGASTNIGDKASVAEITEKLKTFSTKFPGTKGLLIPSDVDLLQQMAALNPNHRFELLPSVTSQNEREGIRKAVLQAQPSCFQFEILDQLVRIYGFRFRKDEVLALAHGMQKTAIALAPTEFVTQGSKGVIPIYPFLLIIPRRVKAIVWLQRCGDKSGAALMTRQFFQSINDPYRRYTAMYLTQAGCGDLVQNLFDPIVEIPRLAEHKRKVTGHTDWSSFMGWGDFAAIQTQFYSPEAPFGWISHVQGAPYRARVLKEWVAALFPDPNVEPPFVSVSTSWSNVSF